MVGEDLINYVRNSLAQGYSEGQVKMALLKNGYNEYDINSAIFQARSTNSQRISPQQPIQDHKKRFIMIVIGILIIMAIVIGAYMLTEKRAENRNRVDPNDVNYSKYITTSSTTSTTLYNPSSSSANVQIFEYKLCDEIDKYFNCFENRTREIKRGESFFIYFKVLLEAGNVADGYRVGFIEDRRVELEGQIINELTRDGLMDLTREVPSTGTFSIPVYNEIVTDNTMEPGTYDVKITVRDKYSNNKNNFELKFVLV